MQKELVIVLDFGGQYNQLVARRVRECNVYCEIYSYKTDLAKIREMKPKGIILTGGPNSCYEEEAPACDKALFEMGIPILGLCYGAQVMMHVLGGTVEKAPVREYGKTNVHVNPLSPLFSDVPEDTVCWMSHFDYISKTASGFDICAHTSECPVAAAENPSEKLYAIQFHPEVTHSHEGRTILRNFLSCAANLKKFDIGDFKRELIREIRERVGNRQVVCGVSGGVDSTVLAVLLHEAGVNMRAIFVDNGLLRKNEAEEVRANFARMNVEIETVDASERFLAALDGESDPEKKRRIIGGLFIDVFWDAVGNAEMLAQGTLYPDVIESASNAKSKASVIKTHHNRVERVLELQAQGKVLEPLAELFKDEVRELGASMGIPHDILWRHPFPGPGLAVRCPGVVTKERLDIIRECDAIFIGNLKKYGWYDKVWQAYAGLIPVKTVGVKGDERSYEWATNLRAIVSEDAMTADWVELPPALLRETSNRILNEVKGINRVLYDISTKPPASIEWE